MTKDHANAIAKRIPGAVAWWPTLGQKDWAVSYSVTRFLSLRLDGRHLKIVVSEGESAISLGITADLFRLTRKFDNAIAAAVADGFPDLREGKDGKS